jgi:hypothetical protein
LYKAQDEIGSRQVSSVKEVESDRKSQNGIENLVSSKNSESP